MALPHVQGGAIWDALNLCCENQEGTLRLRCQNGCSCITINSDSGTELELDIPAGIHSVLVTGDARVTLYVKTQDQQSMCRKGIVKIIYSRRDPVFCGEYFGLVI